MKESFGTFFIKNTLAGLVAFIPFGALIFLLVKAFQIIHDLGKSLAGIPGDHEGTLLLITTLVIFFMVGLFFFAGWFVLPKTKGGTATWLEKNLLSYIPGYQVLKGAVTGVLTNNDQLRPALLQRDLGIYELVLVIEPLSDQRYTVFLPEAPEFNKGKVLVVRGELLKFLSGNFTHVKEVVEVYGYGAGKRDCSLKCVY